MPHYPRLGQKTTFVAFCSCYYNDMIERFKQGKLLWINMKTPSPVEVKKVMKELDIPPQLMTDLTTVVPKNTVQRIDGTVKLTIDFPTIKRVGADHQFEIKFFISKSTLLTVQYEEMEGVDRFKRQFEVAMTLRKAQKHMNGGHIFLSLFNNLYESASTKLDYIESQLSTIEAEIFRNNEKQMVAEIANTSKRLIAFRHVLRGHEDIFRDLDSALAHIFNDAFVNDMKMLQHQFLLLRHRAQTQYETLEALRDTNAAMLYTKQNEIMKLFTIMAFTTFPLTLFSSIFGMNTQNTPLIGHTFDFWIIISVMISAAICFFAFFKHKSWI